jgi:hypothetical protein
MWKAGAVSGWKIARKPSANFCKALRREIKVRCMAIAPKTAFRNRPLHLTKPSRARQYKNLETRPL